MLKHHKKNRRKTTTFASQLKRWMTLLGFSAAELARAVGVTDAAVHHWLNGTREPRRLVGIFRYLDVDHIEFWSADIRSGKKRKILRRQMGASYAG